MASFYHLNFLKQKERGKEEEREQNGGKQS